MNPARHTAQPSARTTTPGFREDLRAVFKPERRWHYLFHAVVVLVALSYWIGSWLKLPDTSWAEIIMYRPKGDNQVFPVITALSRLNFGDPTDAFQYGKGVAGFHAIVLLPHALAFRLFGGPGYAIVDALCVWSYFVAATLLLRRCRLGPLPSLLLASAIATGSLQNLTGKASLALFKLVGTFEAALSDWEFPNLIALNLFDTRIPRPFITEIFVVLLLYFLLRSWHEGGELDARRGLAVGLLMGLLVQGDPYSFSALGLVLAAVVLRHLMAHGWRVPWGFLAALGLSALTVGAYFIYQLSAQHPEAAVRFGLAEYPRTRWVPLPGYGPWLRVAVVGLFAGLLLLATRTPRKVATAATPVGSGRTVSNAGADEEPGDPATAMSRSVAQFSVVLVLAGWLAQPLQLWLIGQGAQIYHYLANTLPSLYAYALVLVLVQFALLATRAWRDAPSTPPNVPARWAAKSLLACFVASLILLGIETPLDAIKTPLTSREEATPWSQIGTHYRAAFRDLDRAFRQEPMLKEAKTFATVCHEVNFLLAGFHNKRAFLPDNGFTTLPDAELERRLFEMAKMCQLHPDRFVSFIQNHVVMNYWLGCAKYWFATDHSFASLTNYSAAQLTEFRKMGPQAPFSLALPPKEIERLALAYATMTFQESDVSTFPDVLVVTSILKEQAIVPHPSLYAEAYTNAAFSVYTRRHTSGVFSAGSPPPTPGR